MIEIKGLSKRYGGNIVYENFNLDIDEGSIVAILGASGSGKTTLLNAVAGLIPCEGTLPKLRCSYIFQTPRLVPNLTVKGNLNLVCKDIEKVEKMLEKVGLKDKSSSYPARLSGGEAQRAAIARAFLYGGEILLMDEPFSSLDLKIKKQIFNLFSELRAENPVTVMMVTHDVDDAVAMSDRAIVISGGKIIYDEKHTINLSPDERRAAIVGALMQ